ncbi:SDR family oxidoreductase [Phenylobacterium sp.]|jgi:3-oxoacyl-[acyl-carrier protein] reductase|uniref:SDR family NAD(P)-dependent oxidoreductase n=1 Tax=Phenylobacterium sp. TaxID=1871053 RepID=UPI002E366247|nr:SDR family oxidoreductase [Phenylobacterium sp.]HEX4708995.1 SDR family oxidoreductase [Phenylobacterium sp.]
MRKAFAGRSAIVTGGGTGIGRAISIALAAQGACVTIIYARSETDAKATVEHIEGLGGRAVARRADVTDEAAVRAAIASAADAFGGLDYLVNNAGITRQLPFADLDAIDSAVWDQLFATNVKGAFFCCRAAAPYLRRQPGSAIVNIGSIAGETGYGSSIPYAVSKAALHGLTKSLARALAPEIRVNGIMPGAVRTRWWQGNEEKMKALSGALPLQRISTPEDIADTVLMLLQAKSMTGQNIKAENGQTL